MRTAALAFLGGCLLALGMAAIALREPSTFRGEVPGPARMVQVVHPAPPRAAEVPAPTLPSTPCVPPFEIIASTLPVALGATPVQASVTVRVAPLPEGAHAFEVIVPVDIGFAGGSLAPSGPRITGFLVGRARAPGGQGQTVTFMVVIPAASAPVEVDGIPQGSSWDAVIAVPRLGPPVVKGASTQGGRTLLIDTNQRPPCVTTP